MNRMNRGNEYTSENCIPVDEFEDITGKIIVINSNYLEQGYRTKKYQLYYAIGGFGTKRSSSGRAVFCKSLITKKDTFRWNRNDILGVLDEKIIPHWARKALQEIKKENK